MGNVPPEPAVLGKNPKYGEGVGFKGEGGRWTATCAGWTQWRKKGAAYYDTHCMGGCGWVCVGVGAAYYVTHCMGGCGCVSGRGSLT